MAKIRHLMFLAGVAVALMAAPPSGAQGKGNAKDKGGPGASGGQVKEKGKAKDKVRAADKDRAKENDKDKPKGPAAASAAGRAQGKGLAKAKSQGKNAQFKRAASASSMPQHLRRYAASRRAQDVIVAAAVSQAFARGRGNDFRIDEDGNGMRLLNREGDRLVYLDERSARDLGRWRVGVIGDEVREGSPAFCRSGEGHPVWGRQWCLDKGFGLGSYEDYRWGRTDDIDDIVFAPGSTRGSLIGDALEGVLGRTAFNRLALHAVTLGLVEPLVGRWVNDSQGPQMLVVNSGSLPVAEFVDANRDNRADNMLVALRTW